MVITTRVAFSPDRGRQSRGLFVAPIMRTADQCGALSGQHVWCDHAYSSKTLQSTLGCYYLVWSTQEALGIVQMLCALLEHSNCTTHEDLRENPTVCINKSNRYVMLLYKSNERTGGCRFHPVVRKPYKAYGKADSCSRFRSRLNSSNDNVNEEIVPTIA